jgi:hypothetical protein
MGDGSLKEPHSYVKKGNRLSLRISHLEPEKRRVGFTQRWGTAEAAEGQDAVDTAADAEAPAPEVEESTNGIASSEEVEDSAASSVDQEETESEG